MAESIVQVTEGSGKKLHTWNRTIGANSVEDEYVLFGENALASYRSVSFGISGATASSHLAQLMAGASLKVRVRKITVYPGGIAASGVVDVQLFRLTTAGTGGTARTPSPLDPADSASGATFMTLPTVKGTEGVTIDEGLFYISTVTTGASIPVVFDFDRPRSKPLIISAGAANGICVKLVAGIASSFVNVTIEFDESSF